MNKNPEMSVGTTRSRTGSATENALALVKSNSWFYEFPLPDGTTTQCYLPVEARQIHKTREGALRSYLQDLASRHSLHSALDVSCHEGYFSLVLEDYVDSVVGIDKNPDSLKKANLISSLIGGGKARFSHSTVEDWPTSQGADLVLCFGLIYHVENPITIMRHLASLAKKALCIETQVLPFSFTGRVEDGNYMWQRDVLGLFALCPDYPANREGGLSDLAMVPTVDALSAILRQFGFSTIRYYEPKPSDYEQFVRRSRVIVFAEK